MKHTRLAALDVSRLGLGTMGMSWAYGTDLDDAESVRTVRRALDLGVAFFDTAQAYGPFVNEELLGRALGADRDRGGGRLGVRPRGPRERRAARSSRSCRS